MNPFTPNDPEQARRYFEDKMTFTTGPVELARVLDRGVVNIVDVRTASDFEKEHIPGTTNLPKEKWASLQGLTHDKPNVLVCYSQVCHLAAAAAAQFAAQGYPVMELEGGFAAWKAHRLPTTGSSGERAAVSGAV